MSTVSVKMLSAQARCNVHQSFVSRLFVNFFYVFRYGDRKLTQSTWEPTTNFKIRIYFRIIVVWVWFFCLFNLAYFFRDSRVDVKFFFYFFLLFWILVNKLNIGNFTAANLLRSNWIKLSNLFLCGVVSYSDC